MKFITFIILFQLFITGVEAKTSYSKPHSNWHLNKIRKKVAKNSDVHKWALKRAFAYYKKNQRKKSLSLNYLAIADYTKKSDKRRLYIINLYTGKVYRHKVAHGKKSGRRGGRVVHSSNRLNSHMTPYGFFKVGTWEGITAKKKYKFMTVKGLEWSNRKVGLPTRLGGRDIVLHTAKYVNGKGRSFGCFAIKPKDKTLVFKRLKNALFYSYTGR